MCGIRGAWHAELDRKNPLSHRGLLPEVKINTQTGTLAHTLLPFFGEIHQPIQLKNIILAFNGEIYNWKELAKKHEIKAKNDAELLASLFESVPETNIHSLLEELDGDYAIVFERIDLKKVFFTRDLLGIRPLWYSVGLGLELSSEKNALSKKKRNNARESHPRHLYVYDLRKKSLTSIRKPFFTEKENNDPLPALLEKAVLKRLPEKGKIGLLFSGGLDSCIIAWILKKNNVPFEPVTISFSENGKDKKNAKEAARMLGIPLTLISPSESRTEKIFRTVLRRLDESVPLKLELAMISCEASRWLRENNISVAMSGKNADVLFGGFFLHQRVPNLKDEILSELKRVWERGYTAEDLSTMTHAVEMRFPYSDHRLIEKTLISDLEKGRSEGNRKQLLRDAARQLGLPEKLIQRKKTAGQYGSGSEKWIRKKAKGLEKNTYLKNELNHPNLKIAGLVSTGKDSHFSIWEMFRRNYDVKGLITLQPENDDSYMFHTPLIQKVKDQAEKMNLPLILKKTKGEKEEELADLETAISDAIKSWKIDGISVGALASSYQRNRVEQVCENLGIKIFTPMWLIDPEHYVIETIKRNFSWVLISSAAPGLNDWVGIPITKDNVRKFLETTKQNQLNPAGEGGEYETFCLNSPLFSEPIKLTGKVIVEDDYRAVFQPNTSQ